MSIHRSLFQQPLLLLLLIADLIASRVQMHCVYMYVLLCSGRTTANRLWMLYYYYYCLALQRNPRTPAAQQYSHQNNHWWPSFAFSFACALGRGDERLYWVWVPVSILCWKILVSQVSFIVSDVWIPVSCPEHQVQSDKWNIFLVRTPRSILKESWTPSLYCALCCN